jgi:hypothetical protein
MRDLNERRLRMEELLGREYYLSRRAGILAQYDEHAQAWSPFLARRYGRAFACAVVQDARGQLEALIPQLPYIGGDENSMTHHLVRSSTSLVFYEVMKAYGKTASEAGNVLYDAVVESVSHLPLQTPMGLEELEAKRLEAKRSEERRYPDDWVWVFVEGDGVGFDYGYDFFECSTQKLYHAQGADEFLPFYCYLDFVTYRTAGWGFTRTMTLAEGHQRCDFRFKAGGTTEKGWPPPFVRDVKGRL